MNAGELDENGIQLWVANRFYYQKNIPLKDAAILANCPLREVRQKWIKRIIDHDGTTEQEGGIEKWMRLGIACGLSSEAMMDERYVRPGVRFAVDAYVNKLCADAAVADCNCLLTYRTVCPRSYGEAAGCFSELLYLDCI